MKEGEKRKKLIETLNKIIADLKGGYDGFLYLYDTLCGYDNEKMTPEEIGATLDKVQKLYIFYKSNKRAFFTMGRRNGKNLLAYKFLREYAAILSAYEKVEKKIKREYGYLP